MSTDSTRRATATAEVLLWQADVRLLLFWGLILSFLALRLLGLSASDAVGIRVLGARGALTAYMLVALAYAAVVVVARARLRRRRAAGWPLVALFVTADLAAIYAAVLLATPLAALERGLLLSFVELLLTQLYFGRPLATYAVGLTALLHVTVLAIAHRHEPVPWMRELWTLQIFLFGAAVYLWLQGGVASRLARLVGLFARMEEGDFSQAYDLGRDRRPDNVTGVGRAYNAMRAQLATTVLTDPLSGCLNRRGFEQQLHRELARCGRAGTPLSLLALDVDHFKLINDSFGHLAGDAVIEEIGELLRETARSGDVVARIGGEEFVVLAPDTPIAGAYHLASRIADAFRARRFRGVEGRIPITVSIGVVAEDAPAEAAAYDLRARADEALYAAKRGGRNRVVLWSHGAPPVTGMGRMLSPAPSPSPSPSLSPLVPPSPDPRPQPTAAAWPVVESGEESREVRGH